MRVFGIRLALLSFLVLSLSVSAQAQTALRGGYAGRAASTVTGDELIGQTNLWVMEVDFKKPRMISVEITDPKTREKKQEWIWYMAYRAINRTIDRRIDATDTDPQNDYDVQPRRPLFVPAFTLVTSKGANGAAQIVSDTVIPEAEPLIRAREKRELKNSVTVVREIPKLTPVGAKAEEIIYGVAMWRGVDPETDFFTVFMGGFSNGYRVTKGPDDQPLTERRTIMQEFWRPGDRFDQKEIEIRLKGTPEWLYRPDVPKALAAPAKPPEPAAEPKQP